MKKNNEGFREDSIDLKTILRLFLKRKWWFIGAFVIVFILGMLYMWSKPVFYEVRYKFSFEDDFLPDDYLIYEESLELYSNESVFIEVEDVPLIFETELIFRALEDIEEIDDYSEYIHSSLQDLDLESDKGTFSLKVKDRDKELADNIARTLVESLDARVMENDIEIFDNTLEMIAEDIEMLKEENALYMDEIAVLDEEIESKLSGSSAADEGYNDIVEKQDIKVLYHERIIDNEYQMYRLDKLYQEFEDERDKVQSRVEIISADPDYNVENNRAINSIIVILLSLLTAIIVVLVVNYVYKLRSQRD
jgi:hypothetical protein